jgi:macrolide-specific efflux system membrane fusion protein
METSNKFFGQSSRKQRRLIPLGIIGIVVIALIAGAIYRKRNPTLVKVGPARKGPVIEAVYGIGTVTAERTYQLKLGVTSTVRSLAVREGDEVRAGQTLVELEGSGSFRAPFAGTITALPFKVGETVFPQAPVLSLVDLSRRYLVVSLEQQGALRVKRSQKAKISIESIRDQTFDGKVRSVFSNDNQFLVHIEANSLVPQVLPGMTADVAIETGKKENALLVPVTAVSQGWVARSRGGSRPERVSIQTAVQEGAWIEVTGGDVLEGDEIWASVEVAKVF